MPEHTTPLTFEPGRGRAALDLYHEPGWYACSTRSRHEKRVDQLLRRQGIESFLPVVSQVTQWKDRKRVVRWPLFAGYTFGCFTLSQLSQVLATRGVASVVGIRGMPQPIPAAEIENVRAFAAAAAEANVVMERAALVNRGSWVRVSTGPFQGVEGVVVERRGRSRVLVGIHAIGQGMEIDVPLNDLVPIPDPS